MTATLANAHALFCGLKMGPSYLATLDIGDDARRSLMDARQKVRAALKIAASQITMLDDYWQGGWQTAAKRPLRLNVEVKFMTQGSFAYKTINYPAQPHQEIDLDDGMYVPVEFLDNGQPALTANGLFEFVVNALLPLARTEGWQDVIRKQNCVRVKLWDGAHLDIPIYSIPRDRFVQITEALAKSFSSETAMTRTGMMDSYRLPSDKIMLARNDGTWIQSDPQRLQDWVDGRVAQYGPVFRRLCRFFKGWRDYTWQDSPLSSLCLMCAVDQALMEFANLEGGLPSEDRDDFLMMEVAKRLPQVFQGDVNNPVLDSCLNGWDDDVRQDIITKASALCNQMVAALERTGDAEEVVRKLRASFGQRMPYRPDAVKIAGAEIAAIVHAQPIKNPAPAVIASTSG
jgi:hypothetical protein